MSQQHGDPPWAEDVTQWPSWMGRHPRVCAPWTPEEETLLAARFRDGQPLKDIAYAHGRAESGIRSRLFKLGLITEFMEQANDTELRASVSELERKVRMLCQTVYGGGKKWRR